MANTTADKLQGTLDSKEAIRLALNTKGREVTESAPFREYANEVLAIETGGDVDPYIEYMKYQDLSYELSNGRAMPTEEEYTTQIKPRVLTLLNYILGENR